MISKRRRAPNASEKIAAALLQIKRGDNWLIPEPLRSSGDARAICAAVQWDHGTPHAIGGGTDPSNMRPMTPRDHAEKTKRDVAAIAKGKRLAKAQAEFRARLLGKTAGSETGTGVNEGSPRPSPMRSQGFRGWLNFKGQPVFKRERT